MAIRLLPFRQYNEQDVVNLFSFECEGWLESVDPFTNGTHDAGVLVGVTNGDLAEGPTKYIDANYLGKTSYPHVGKNQYPVVPIKVGPATGNASALGVTLKQTLTHDENGEKLIYYPQKALELNAVKSGDAVPVLSRGVITLDDGAFETFPAPGQYLNASTTTPGKFNAVGGTVSTSTALGVAHCLATGERVADADTDYFADSSSGGTETGKYAIIKLNL
jgi:hypothetical protein